MFKTFAKGQLAVLEVQKRALSLGYHCCFPTVEARFDMVLVSDSGKMFRVQIKYADNDASGKYNGAVYLDLRKKTRGCGEAKNYMSSEIDAVLVFVPRINEVLWLPPEIFNDKTGIMLRIKKAEKIGNRPITYAESLIWKS